MQELTDRAMKERIIGAVVLVVFAVLVVPIFLDGSVESEQQVVSQQVTLPGQSDAARQQEVVLDLNRQRPVPATSSEQAPEPVVMNNEPVSQPAITQPEPVIAEPAPEVVPEPEQVEPEPVAVQAETTPEPELEPEPASATAAPVSTDSTGMWAVQLGSFSDRENADRLAATLRSNGYAAFLSRLDTGGTQLSRVRVGPQADRAAAEEVAAQLQRSGYTGQVVPHP